MNAIIRTSSGIHLVPVESQLLENRKVYLEGEITAQKAIDISKQLLLLNERDAQKPINIIINSEGGNVNSGLLIYDLLQSCNSPITTICMGKAYSMAAVIFISANNGRYMFPHSELMIHEPRLSGGISGDSFSIKSMSDSLLAQRDTLNRILSLHSGHSIEEIDQATTYDHFYGPTESINFGFCDGIIGLNQLIKENY